MTKNDIFDTILRAVSEETEIPALRILSARKDSETVDARHLLVYFLSDTGFTTSYISERIKVTERTVTNIRTHFEDRLSCQKMFRIQYERIRKRIGNNLFAT